MYIERDKENISTQELENDAKGIRQTKNPGLLFSTSVRASADRSREGKEPLVIIL
jgi:hypothetical protein